MAGWSSSKPRSGGNQNRRLEDDIDLFKFPDNEWVQMRSIGPYTSYCQIWFEIVTNDGKKVRIPKLATNYMPEKEEYDGKCPFYDSGKGQVSQKYVSNWIIRDLQENPPRKLPNHTEYEKKRRSLLGEKFKLKEHGSKSWTPVKAIDLTSFVVEKLANLKPLNKHKNKKTGEVKTYDISDPKYGRDIMIKYNSKAKGAAKWEVQIAEKTALTEEELDYLLQPLEDLPSLKPLSASLAKEEWKNLARRLIDKDGDDEDGPKTKKTKDKYLEDDDDENDDVDDIEDEDDEEEKPKKKTKKKLDIDEDDEEEKPKPKKKKKKPVDDDDDDEEDEPKSKKKKKKKPVDDFDDDFEDDLD